jgi:tetratricopeptide (TPR) repeat protein
VATSRVTEPEVLDLLTRLVEKSLVVYEEDEQSRGRYRLLDTVRQYAREKLAAEVGSDTAPRRHRDYFLALAEAANEKLQGSEQVEWLKRLDQEHDNLRESLDECRVDREGGEAGLRLAAAVQRFWQIRGYFAEAEARSRAALEHPGARERTRTRAQALTGAGALAHIQAHYETARIRLEEALSIWQAVGDRAGLARCLVSLGNVAVRQGDYERGLLLYEDALEQSRRSGSRPLEANALNSLGIVAQEQGEYVLARTRYEEALAISGELGDRIGEATALGNLGIVAKAQGDWERARACYEESLAIRRALGERRGTVVALINLGELACEQGDFGTALSLLREGLHHCREFGDRRDAAAGLQELGELFEAMGNLTRAAQLQGAAASLRDSLAAPVPPSERPALDRHLSALRAALGEEAFEVAYAAGRARSWEQAIAYTLEEGDG